MNQSTHKFLNHIMNHTLRTLVAWAKLQWSRANDALLNIETTRDEPTRAPTHNAGNHLKGQFSDKALHDDNNYYESPDYWYVRKIARSFSSPEQEVFYDIGCGKGRILCVMARKPFKRIVGIDLFEELCESARANAHLLNGRKSTINILCEDAAKADMSDGTVYFLFNPFGPATMKDVLANIEQSLITNPRNITLIYYNAAHADVLRSSGWLREVRAFHTATGRRVSFWENSQEVLTPDPKNNKSVSA